MGPLKGIKILEIKGLGPGPYAGMLLADMGADVIVVERASKPMGTGLAAQTDIHSRGKRSIALDLKTPEGVSTYSKWWSSRTFCLNVSDQVWQNALVLDPKFVIRSIPN